MQYTALLVLVSLAKFTFCNEDRHLPCQAAGGSCHPATSTSCSPSMRLQHAHCPQEGTCCKLTESEIDKIEPELRKKKPKIRCRKTKVCKKLGGKCQAKTKPCKSTVRKEGICAGDSCICCIKACKTKKKCKKKGGKCTPKELGCGFGEIIGKGCKKNCLCCNEVCGRANLNPERIPGGEDVHPPNKYPWMVRFTPSSCGGSIISSEYVLTAAHCIDNSKYKITVIVGDHDSNSETDDIVGVTREIMSSRVVRHKEYNDVTIENDIALIKLSEPLDLNSNKEVGSICLPDSSTRSYKGMNGTVIGWGDRAQNQPLTSVLQEKDVPILGNECKGYKEPEAIYGKMLCAGLANDGDSCGGDSGGPLFVRDSNDKHTIVGIVSFGPSLECIGDIGVYTDVTKYLQWINDNMI